MTLTQYLEKIASEYKTGRATEHSYRPYLKDLVESLLPGVTAINEPKRIAAGAPDYVLTRNNIPVGFIEAKDLGDALDKTAKSNQLQRYREGLDNLILTDYIRFIFFRNDQIVADIRLADLDIQGKLVLKDNVWNNFTELVKNFGSFTGQTIKSAEKLAQMMAAKARLLQDILNNALETEDEQNRSLQEQYEAFQDTLLKDITHAEFADLYAQTIAYGMFAARLHDDTIDNFSRQEAANLIPKSNPFLRQLFQYIAGYDIDTRIEWIVDELATVFLHTNVKDLLRDFGKTTQRNDPVIHFYETFLAEYNPKLRKSRGVYYTPEPVVNFIVRAVDDILQTEFGIKDGLADTVKIEIETIAQGTDRRRADNQKRGKEMVHRVQILDPATGTGTFLSEVIKYLYNTRFSAMPGIWSDYVERDLLPRLHGFELLMASYAMCHLKLDLLLRDTGYVPKDPNKRLRVYLTNSLEEGHYSSQLPFAFAITDESNLASRVKKEIPVMAIIGNPPYSGVSSNLTQEMRDLVEKYKFLDGDRIKEKGALQLEKNLNDDYIKFIAFSQDLIEKNGEGVIGFITNHGYLSNPTLRGMRWQLLKTFDKIFVIDLHGNYKKKEVTPDGSLDQNIFDIQQGVAILLAVKTKERKNNLADLYHSEFWGKRDEKYAQLWDNNLKSIEWKKIDAQEPFFLFEPRNEEEEAIFYEYPSITDLFKISSGGIITARDKFVIDYDEEIILKNAQAFKNSSLDNSALCKSLGISEKKGWNISNSRDLIDKENDLQQFIKNINYRPFDTRKIFYHDSLIWTTARPVMQHFLLGENIGVIVGRQGQVVGNMQWNLVSVTDKIIDFNNFYRGGGATFPLYLYPEPSALDPRPARVPNLDRKLAEDFARRIGLSYVATKVPDAATPDTLTPLHLLHYIYGILHHPGYRERYKEFLKIDFPRIPYPESVESFRAIAAIGAELVSLHLLEHPSLSDVRHHYIGVGDSLVAKGFPRFDNGNIFINDTQYFEGVPQSVWEFYIGGYQPAQKWLKDRRERTLSYDDIRHYLRVLIALAETEGLMRELELLEW